MTWFFYIFLRKWLWFNILVLISAERDQQNSSLSSAQQIWGWKTLIECHPASNMFTPRRAWFADKLNEGARAGWGGKMQKNALSGPRIRNGWGGYDEHFGTWSDEFEIGISSRDQCFNVGGINFAGTGWMNWRRGVILKPPRIPKIRWNRRNPQWFHGNQWKNRCWSFERNKKSEEIEAGFWFGRENLSVGFCQE